MSRFRSTVTGVVVSVDDSKDSRFTSGPFEPYSGEDDEQAAKRGPGRPRKSE